jgi:hypothetical protein
MSDSSLQNMPHYGSLRNGHQEDVSNVAAPNVDTVPLVRDPDMFGPVLSTTARAHQEALRYLRSEELSHKLMRDSGGNRGLLSMCFFKSDVLHSAVSMPSGHMLDLLVKYVAEQDPLTSLEVDVSTDTDSLP